MPTDTPAKQRIANLVRTEPGLTDREIADRIFGADVPQQPTNTAARALAATGKIVRRRRADGKLGNYPADGPIPGQLESVAFESVPTVSLSEDEVKRSVQRWLESAGWQVAVAWGHGRGIDIDARRNDERWVIEAKGCGSLNPMRVNYFIAMLGELLQRMSDPAAEYGIALPDIQQFRGLWERLPKLAKARTGISALFVGPGGQVRKVG